jgi:hypothetical protein
VPHQSRQTAAVPGFPEQVEFSGLASGLRGRSGRRIRTLSELILKNTGTFE